MSSAQDTLTRDRQHRQPLTDGVENRIGNGRRDRADRRFAGTPCRRVRHLRELLGVIEEHDLDRRRHLVEMHDRVGGPEQARDAREVESYLLDQRAANALDDVAFDDGVAFLRWSAIRAAAHAASLYTALIPVYVAMLAAVVLGEAFTVASGSGSS